jgi:uncharacterized protein (DUF3820 family)
MGCKPSVEVDPLPPAKTMSPSYSPVKRERPETPEPGPSTRLPDPVTPISPTKRSRHSSSRPLSALSNLAPLPPLTPPGGRAPAFIKPEATVQTPLSAPRPQSNSRALRNSRSNFDAPPSPTPVRRRADVKVEALTVPLRSVSLSASPATVAASPPPAPAVAPEHFQLTTGPYQGCTIRQLPKEYRKHLSNDSALLSRTPSLSAALTAWSSTYTLTSGRHKGKRLADVPLYYLNEFVLRLGDDKRPGHEDLYVALKFHFAVREPEKPGQHYILTFGKNEGEGLENVPSYVTWIKNKGIPTQEGYEDLADAIEYLALRDLHAFDRASPGAATYMLPLEFGYGARMPLAQLGEAEMRDLFPERDFGVHTERTLTGRFVYPGMRDAVERWWLMFECSRWNWRRERDVETGEVVAFAPDLEAKGLLFPRVGLREKMYVGYARG